MKSVLTFTKKMHTSNTANAKKKGLKPSFREREREKKIKNLFYYNKKKRKESFQKDYGD